MSPLDVSNWRFRGDALCCNCGISSFFIYYFPKVSLLKKENNSSLAVLIYNHWSVMWEIQPRPLTHYQCLRKMTALSREMLFQDELAKSHLLLNNLFSPLLY